MNAALSVDIAAAIVMTTAGQAAEPGQGIWSAVDAAPLQRQIDSGQRCTVASNPAGKAIIECLTVTFDKAGPAKAIIVARNSHGERVLANATGLERMLSEDPFGCEREVVTQGDVNEFIL